MKSEPSVSVGNHWLCQAPYGHTAGQMCKATKRVRWSWGSMHRRGMQRRNVLIRSCQISVACMPHTHNRALSRRSCLNWWREEVRKRQRAIGRACWWWWCAAENWCWDGLTGSVSVHCKTVIQSDRVVFRSPPHKGYAIASSPHDRMNEPLLLQPEMLIRSVLKYLQPHSQSMSGFMGKSALALNISPCLWPIVRLRLHFRNDVLGNRVCWAVSSGCMILPAWLKSARELLPVPVHLLQLLVWSILDSFAQGCVCILTAESHRNKKKKEERRGNR